MTLVGDVPSLSYEILCDEHTEDRGIPTLEKIHGGELHVTKCLSHGQRVRSFGI